MSRQDELSIAWIEGLSRIPALALSGFALLGAPRRLPSGVRPRTKATRMVVCAMFVGVWTVALPLGIDDGMAAVGITQPLDDSHHTALLVTTIGAFALLLAAGLGWAGASRHLDRADTFLADEFRREVARWLRGLYKRQFIGWVVAAIAFGLIYWLVDDARPYFPTSPGSLLSLCQFIIIAGTIGFFAWELPGVTPRITYAEPHKIKPYRLDPAATPAIRLLVELTSVGSLLLLAVLLIQTVSWYFINSAIQPSAPVTAAFGAGFGLVILGIIRAGVIPTIQLHTWIARLKLELLERLNEDLMRLEATPAPRNAKKAASRAMARAEIVEEFFHVTSIENGPFRSSAMIQFGGAVVGAVVAYALVIIFGDPDK